MADKEKRPRLSSLVVDGAKYRTNLTDKYKNREKYKENDPSEIKAFIPGTIAEIQIKNGRKVKEGDTILILEAMKMMNTVLAPMDGILKLNVKEGEVVAKKHLLFTIK
jgi:biotin carboxyl carrier protein